MHAAKISVNALGGCINGKDGEDDSAEQAGVLESVVVEEAHGGSLWCCVGFGTSET